MPAVRFAHVGISLSVDSTDGVVLDSTAGRASTVAVVARACTVIQHLSSAKHQSSVISHKISMNINFLFGRRLENHPLFYDKKGAEII